MAASRMRKRTASPGYNPAAGRADPGAGGSDGNFTHSPHRNGTICGQAISDASSYTVEAPTCPECLRHYQAVQRSAQRLQASARASQAAYDRDAAAAPSETK